MPEEDEVTLYDYVKAISKRKWLIIIGTFACIFTAAIVTLLRPRVYETRAILTMVGPDTPDVKVGVAKIPTSLSLEKFFNFLVNDGDLHLEVIRKLGLDKSPDELTPQALGQIITFSLAKDSRAITISVRYSHPQKAKHIANTTAEVVKDYYQVLNEAEISRCQNLIDEEFNLVQASLVEEENNLQTFKKTVDVDFLRTDVKTRSSQEIHLARGYSNTRMLVVGLEAQLARIQEELQELELQKQDKMEDPVYKKILHNRYLELDRAVTNTRGSLAGAKAKELFLKTEIEENRRALNKLWTQLAEKEPEEKRLMEVHYLAKKDYQAVRKSYPKSAKLLAVAKARQLKTVSTAATPARPVERKTKQILLVAVVVGLLAFLVLAFVLEYLEKMRGAEGKSRRKEG